MAHIKSSVSQPAGRSVSHKCVSKLCLRQKTKKSYSICFEININTNLCFYPWIACLRDSSPARPSSLNPINACSALHLSCKYFRAKMEIHWNDETKKSKNEKTVNKNEQRRTKEKKEGKKTNEWHIFNADIFMNLIFAGNFCFQFCFQCKVAFLHDNKRKTKKSNKKSWASKGIEPSSPENIKCRTYTQALCQLSYGALIRTVGFYSMLWIRAHAICKVLRATQTEMRIAFCI